ncbi:Clp protease ClpP [Paenibacillaceae bacterium]|nr:Clp protease ClpP [Paenibacillaceae bacterium]
MCWSGSGSAGATFRQLTPERIPRKGVNKLKRIDIKGPIIRSNSQWIYDLFEMEATSPAKVDALLQEAGGEDVEVLINSGGGDVFAGSEICTALNSYSGKVTVKIIFAGSAASVIGTAGSKVMIAPTGQIMIHCASISSYGDRNDHQQTVELLQSVDRAIANAYILKTGLPQAEILGLMEKETWLDAQTALKKGFVDEIMFDHNNQIGVLASTSVSNDAIPDKVIERIRNEFAKLKQSEGENEEMNGQQTNAAPVNQAVAQPPVAAAPVVPAPQAAGATPDIAAQERERLKGIDAIAANIDPSLVNEAKYDNPITAEQLAFKAMKEGKLLNAGMFHQAVAANQAAGTEQVQALSQQQQTNDPDVDLSNVAGVNSVFQALAAHAQANRQQGRG